MKPLVIYCSKSGITQELAERIAGDLSCDTLKILPRKEYGSYLSAIIRVGGEILTKKSPEFINELPDLSAYDTILFGYPIWYSAPPEYALSFMRSCDLVGKTIIPFATAGSSRIDATLKKVEKLSSQVDIKYPFTWAMAHKDDYEQWLSEIKKL